MVTVDDCNMVGCCIPLLYFAKESKCFLFPSLSKSDLVDVSCYMWKSLPLLFISAVLGQAAFLSLTGCWNSLLIGLHFIFVKTYVFV